MITSITGTSFMQAAFATTDGPLSRVGTGGKGNVMVVLSLRGGADGLSMVVPHADPAYAIARPKIAIPPAALIAKDDTFGLHPKFEKLLPMWNAGKFAAVQAVGLAVPNRSHFAAIEEVEDADPGSPERCGWLNRLVGVDSKQSAVEAMLVGSPIVPTSLYGPEPVLAVSKIDDMVLPGRKSDVNYGRRVGALTTAFADDDTALGRGARGALEMSEAFADVAGGSTKPAHGATYPKGDMGSSLAQSARIIRADIGAEVITVDAGSWDMHVQVGDLSGGLMTSAVEELANSLDAFFTDLGPDGSRVTVVTISEFGRRVQENANAGLDHGWGNVMLLLGAGVIGGKYYGTWPGLGPESLVDGDLKVTNDYRSVLANVVDKRFNADLSKVFPGFTPEDIGAMSAA